MDILQYDLNIANTIVTTGGNVGIGTSNPSAKLDVVGNIRITNGSLLATGNSNTVGNLFTTGGNVGIGTNSPTAKLHIVSNVTNGTMLLNNNIDGGVLNFHDVHHSIWGRKGFNGIGGQGSNDVMEFHEYGDFSFWTGGDIQNQTEKFRISQNGNVGIGTTSPTTKLDVVGNIRITGGSLLATGNSNTLGSLFTTGGNVGIGTDSPSSRLHVRDIIEIGNGRSPTPGNEGTLIIGGANGSSAWKYWQIRVGGNGSSNYNTERLRFLVINDEKMTIDASGNVGIGTSSPTQKLHISNGGILSYGSDSYQHIGYTIQTPNYVYQLGISGSTGWATVGTFGIYNSNAGSHSLVIQPNGNIGIGTNSPNSRLHVTGSSRIEGTLQVGAGSASSTFLIDLGTSGAGGTRSGYIYGDGTFFNINNQQNGPMVLYTNNLERLRITGDGNIGIGTNSPNSKLHVHSSSETILRLSSPGYTGFDIISGIAGHVALFNRNNNYMHFGTNNNERMRITADGNVGIGTSNPETTLHVAGTTKFGSVGSNIRSIRSFKATLGSGNSGVNRYGINYGTTYGDANKLVINITTTSNADNPDTYAYNISTLGTSSCILNVYRIDGAGAGWGNNLVAHVTITELV